MPPVVGGGGARLPGAPPRRPVGVAAAGRPCRPRCRACLTAPGSVLSPVLVIPALLAARLCLPALVAAIIDLVVHLLGPTGCKALMVPRIVGVFARGGRHGWMAPQERSLLRPRNGCRHVYLTFLPKGPPGGRRPRAPEEGERQQGAGGRRRPGPRNEPGTGGAREERGPEGDDTRKTRPGGRPRAGSRGRQEGRRKRRDEPSGERGGPQRDIETLDKAGRGRRDRERGSGQREGEQQVREPTCARAAGPAVLHGAEPTHALCSRAPELREDGQR